MDARTGKQQSTEEGRRTPSFGSAANAVYPGERTRPSRPQQRRAAALTRPPRRARQLDRRAVAEIRLPAARPACKETVRMAACKARSRFLSVEAFVHSVPDGEDDDHSSVVADCGCCRVARPCRSGVSRRIPSPSRCRHTVGAGESRSPAGPRPLPRGARGGYAELRVPAFEHRCGLEVPRAAGHAVPHETRGSSPAGHHPLPQRQPGRAGHPAADLAALARYESGLGACRGLVDRSELRRTGSHSVVARRIGRHCDRSRRRRAARADHVHPPCQHVRRGGAEHGMHPHR
jgi:hypothetical protein